MKYPYCTFCIVLLCLFSFSANATVFTFDSAGDWDVISNWKDMNYPGTTVALGDTVFIDAAVVIPMGLVVTTNEFLDGNPAASITIAGQLNINNNANLEGDVIVTGILNVNSETFAYKSVTNSGTITADATNIQFLNSFSNSGIVNVDGLLNADADFVNTNMINVSATGMLLTVGEFDNDGTVTVDGEYQLFGILNNNNVVTVSGDLNSTTMTSNISNSGTLSISGTTDINGTFVNNADGVLNVLSAAVARFSDDEASINNNGQINIEGELIID